MLHTLSPAPGSRKSRKRVARGNSGKGGMTAGRGTKGQKARTGTARKFGFEGGQTPLLRRQPKLGGFRNPRKTWYEVINLDVLERKLESGRYDADALRARRLVRTGSPVKILGRGSVSKKFDLIVQATSKSAKEAIEKAGGSILIQ